VASTDIGSAQPPLWLQSAPESSRGNPDIENRRDLTALIQIKPAAQRRRVASDDASRAIQSMSHRPAGRETGLPGIVAE
jgi:hypothetical protein